MSCTVNLRWTKLIGGENDLSINKLSQPKSLKLIWEVSELIGKLVAVQLYVP